MSNTYTPFANHTDEELLREVMNKQDATDLEIELMLRVEFLHHQIEDLMAPYPSDAEPADDTQGELL